MFNKVEYDNAYRRNNYDTLSLNLPKGAKEIVKQHCLAIGQNVTQYISGLILWDLGLDDWTDAIKKGTDEK